MFSFKHWCARVREWKLGICIETRKKTIISMMPRSFLVKKKRGTCAGWQWKEPEQLHWEQDNTVGKKLSIFTIIFCNYYYYYYYSNRRSCSGSGSKQMCYCIFFYLLNSSFCFLLLESQNNSEGNETTQTVTLDQLATTPGCRTASGTIVSTPLVGLGGQGSEARSRITLWDSFYHPGTLTLVSRVKVRSNIL